MSSRSALASVRSHIPRPQFALLWAVGCCWPGAARCSWGWPLKGGPHH
jgi:hypothetical protein